MMIFVLSVLAVRDLGTIVEEIHEKLDAIDANAANTRMWPTELTRVGARIEPAR